MGARSIQIFNQNLRREFKNLYIDEKINCCYIESLKGIPASKKCVYS